MWNRKIICLTTEAGTGIHAYSNGNFVAFEIDLDDTSELEKMIEESNKAWEEIDPYLRLQATNITLVLMNKSNDLNATEQFTNRVEHRGKYTAEIANYLKPLICSKIQHCRRGNSEGRDLIFKILFLLGLNPKSMVYSQKYVEYHHFHLQVKSILSLYHQFFYEVSVAFLL